MSKALVEATNQAINAIADALDIPKDFLNAGSLKVTIDMSEPNYFNFKTNEAIFNTIAPPYPEIYEVAANYIHRKMSPFTFNIQTNSDFEYFSKVLIHAFGVFGSRMGPDQNEEDTLEDWEKSINLRLEVMKNQPNDENNNYTMKILHSNKIAIEKGKEMYVLLDSNQGLSPEEKTYIKGCIGRTLVEVIDTDQTLKMTTYELTSMAKLQRTLGYNLGTQLYNNFTKDPKKTMPIVNEILFFDMNNGIEPFMKVYRELQKNKLKK
ncbi:MAG: hypothetical protein ABIB43_05865 [archaeon]